MDDSTVPLLALTFVLCLRLLGWEPFRQDCVRCKNVDINSYHKMCQYYYNLVCEQETSDSDEEPHNELDQKKVDHEKLLSLQEMVNELKKTK